MTKNSFFSTFLFASIVATAAACGGPMDGELDGDFEGDFDGDEEALLLEEETEDAVSAGYPSTQYVDLVASSLSIAASGANTVIRIVVTNQGTKAAPVLKPVLRIRSTTQHQATTLSTTAPIAAGRTATLTWTIRAPRATVRAWRGQWEVYVDPSQTVDAITSNNRRFFPNN